MVMQKEAGDRKVACFFLLALDFLRAAVYNGSILLPGGSAS